LPGHPRRRSLSVGKRLSASSRISVRPFGLCVRCPSAPPPSLVIVFGCLPCNPGLSRSQRRGGSTELFAAASFGRITTRRTSMTDAFSAPRMRTPRGPSRTLWSLHRIVSTSDVLTVTGRHTRVGILSARCAVLSSARRRLVSERAIRRLTWS
jgi:hypothetical protein